MSETTPTFAESKGLESNQHAKKLAKEKAKKASKKYPVMYTQNGQKLLSLTFKPNGVYRNYLGNLSKKQEKESLSIQIKNWKSEGLFIREDQIEEYAEKFAKNGFKQA